MGFSTSTSMPASRRRQPMRPCSAVGTARLTASIFSRGQRIDVAEHAGFEFGGNLRGAFGVGIDHADQFRAFQLTPDAGVIAAKLADADDGNSNGVLIHDFLLAADFGDSWAATRFGREGLNGDMPRRRRPE